eukprot:TRINITY_DN3630_c0_g1_i3.p1 TRINITY_DN3630_c0_g1~~TRINITY_DN3630_c0_g1_i3.p1  ORF type:complete len:569 (-),score=139.22 TRINITY_DN3630_c0_g1_i3:696-2402(-)
MSQPVPVVRRHATHRDAAQKTTIPTQALPTTDTPQTSLFSKPKPLESSENATRLFVSNSLEMKLKGDPLKFLFLIEQLKTGKPEIRVGLLKGLALCASSINEKHIELLNFISTFSLSGTDQITQSFIALCMDLVTTNSCHLPSVLTMLANNLKPRKIPNPVIGDEEMYDKVLSEKILIQVTTTLRTILRLVPLSVSVVGQILCEKFPHLSFDSEEQLHFLRGVLSVCDFAPSLREQLLSLVFSKLIQIDSEITLDDEEEEANPEGGALTDMLFSMDLDGAIGGTPSSQHGGAEKTSSNADLAEKLDVLMDTMFCYLESTVKGPNSEDCFAILLKIFEKLIVSTLKSKYVQFLIFKISSMNKVFMEKFVNSLKSKSLGRGLFETSYGDGVGTLVKPRRFHLDIERSTSVPLLRLGTPQRGFTPPTLGLMSLSTAFTPARTPMSTLRTPIPLTPALHRASTPLGGNPTSSAGIPFSTPSHPPSTASSASTISSAMKTSLTINDLTRATYCAYLGGYLARAAFLPAEILESCLCDMLSWAVEYEEGLELVFIYLFMISFYFISLIFFSFFI